MGTILWQRGLGLLRNSRMFLLMLLLPLLFTFAFSNMGTASKISIPLYDEEGSLLSQTAVSYLNRSTSYQFEPVSLEKLKVEVAEGRAEAGIIIPKGFSEGMESGNVAIQMVKSKDSTLIPSLQGVIQASLMQMHTEQTGVKAILHSLTQLGLDANQPQVTTRVEELLTERWRETLPISTAGKTAEGSIAFRYDPKLQSSLGFMLFFVIYSIIFSLSEMLNDRRQGIWDRLLISPLRKREIYLGNFLYSFMVGYGQLLILLGASRLLFGVNWGEGWGPILFLLAIYTVTIAAFGMLLSGFVKNTQQLNAVVPIFAVSFAMLGGAFWPLEVVTSPWLITIAKGIPLYYPMSAIKEILLNQQGWNVVWLPTAVLLLMTVLFMGVGVYLFEKKGGV